MKSLKNNLNRANAARIIFYLLVTISIISLYSHYLQYQLLKNSKNGIAITISSANANDQRQLIISWINILLLITSSILFLIWVYRAYDNLYKLKPEKLSCTPGWAVGNWFVPFVSLYKPYHIMKEIFIETQEYVLSEEQKQKTQKAYIVGTWWTLYLISIFASYFVIIAFGGNKTIDGLINLTIAMMISTVFLIVVKVVTLVMINKITIYESELLEYVNNPISIESSNNSLLQDESMNVTGI